VLLLLPKGLSFHWNYGSCLGLVLASQFFTGVLLTLHFTQSFDRLIIYARQTFFGFKLRYCHANGASFFMLLIFLHLFRGIYFLSSNKSKLWLSRCFLLLLSIGASFLGYVLPYGQISY
jgi:quinol-cytochrome oxidoreductase complex cytochrome b subunit